MTRVWLDGQVMDAAQARIGALDRGLTVGDGVFETCKVIAGRPFALTRHLRRLRASATALELECPQDGVLRAAIDELLGSSPALLAGTARLRITVTAGPGPVGSSRGDARPTLMVSVSVATPWPAHIEAVTVPWPRNERSAIAGVKTTSYAENVVALAAAHRRGAHEALLANTVGHLCEGTGSNVMLSVGGRLVTPPLSSGCLPGITRELFLEWSREEGLAVQETDVAVAALAEADDVLLLSSTRDVQHVAVVDGRRVDGDEWGRRAIEIFARRAALGIDP